MGKDNKFIAIKSSECHLISALPFISNFSWNTDIKALHYLIIESKLNYDASSA